MRGHQLLDHGGAQVVGPGVAQGALEGLAHGGPAGGGYDDFSHG